MDPEKQFSVERVEKRSVAFTDVDTSDDGWTFEGLAAVYDQETDLGDWTESMARGSFRKSLARGENVPMLHEHNQMLPVLATTAGGTLVLSEDTKGLRVKANIAKHYVGEATRELVRRGDIRGMSVGFIAGRGNSKIENRGGKPHRNIMDFRKLLDVSPTWEPAYSGTSAELRSLATLQMAESLGVAQQFLLGTYQQPEDQGTTTEAGTGNEEAKTDEELAAEEAAREASKQEQRSGVDTAKAESAARKRRLQMMGLTLPRRDL